jgi:uncharacterized protein
VRSAIVDTGPLVAFLDRSEQHHRWVVEKIEELDSPLLVCEPVLAEAMHLAGCTVQTSRKWCTTDRIPHRAACPRSAKAASQYRDRPMSLADACIVRMAEIHERHAACTLDSDFTVYRKSGRVPLELIHPAQG